MTTISLEEITENKKRSHTSDDKIHPWRQGIGTKFMRALINKVRADGIKRIDLCAEADNPVALNFYKKLGFQLEGILKKYFKRPNENQYIDEHMLVLFPDDETVS